jgi:hypothetical protein
VTSKKDDPWKEWRNNNGEFRYWFHSWGYDAKTGVTLPFWPCLPWVCHEPLSAEFLTAMYHMGVLKTWPGDWKRWVPPLQSGYWNMPNSPVYGVVLNRGVPGALRHYLRTIENKYATREEFLARVIKLHMLFTKETMNANTRSSEAGSASV